MSIRKKKREIKRLIEAFESEAKKFHDIKLSTFYVTQEGASEDRKFHSSNHAIMLWQYYGTTKKEGGMDEFVEDLKNSDMQWGLRGANLTRFAVVEGDECNLFMRMAKRAANIFSSEERKTIQSGVRKEIIESEEKTGYKIIVTSNNNDLAVWINYLLYYLSLVNPGKENISVIEPDPFSLSLFALEQLEEQQDIGACNSKGKMKKLESIKFKVALSFPGEKRGYAENLANILRANLGENQVFYDNHYKSQLARPNLDILLQNIYRNSSDLIVIFLCQKYSEKEWCGLEWRAIREIIKIKEDQKIFFIRFDNANIDGVFSQDGYINANTTSEAEMASLIIERLEVINQMGHRSR